MNEMETLSEIIRSRRKALGISLSRLARLADTSAATLSRYENGWTRFEVATLRKLAVALGCRLRIEFEPVSQVDPADQDRKLLLDRLRRLFWDVDFHDGMLASHATWAVERVLQFGQLEDVHALQVLMGRTRFLESVQDSRLPEKETSFWNSILRREGMECMRRSSRTRAWTS